MGNPSPSLSERKKETKKERYIDIKKSQHCIRYLGLADEVHANQEIVERGVTAGCMPEHRQKNPGHRDCMSLCMPSKDDMESILCPVRKPNTVCSCHDILRGRSRQGACHSTMELPCLTLTALGGKVCADPKGQKEGRKEGQKEGRAEGRRKEGR